jgi:alkanesulfonate monooxygenase SsuD/methylene tetrahydromethanopterin reductase-like flavin-dependent oxidoreductase (luciferase family)
MAVLGETPEAAQTKFAAIPPERTGFFGHLPIVGTPEEIIPRVQTLVGAGFQYLIFIVWDPETLRLLGEQVLPEVTVN